MLLQGVPAKRYDIRRPIISNERSKQTPVRGLAPTHPTDLGIIRVPYPNYGLSGSTQSKFVEFIPPDFQRSDTLCMFRLCFWNILTCLNYVP